VARTPLQPIVIRFGRLGDMIMLTALLHALHERFGSPCLLIAAGPWNAPLFQSHPDVARLLTLPRHFPAVLSGAGWQVLLALRRRAASPVYVCEYQPRQVQRIRRLLALGGVARARCLYITEALPGDEDHWVDRLARFGALTPAALQGGQYPPLAHAATPRLAVEPAERQAVRAWLAAQGADGAPVVLVQPGNFRTLSRHRDDPARRGADDKAWPLERWLELLAGVHRELPGAFIVLCGAPQEGALLREIAQAAALAGLAVAELPLPRLLALCEVAHSMISIDTGPAHAAAALGVPLVVMFGAEAPQRWLPRSPSGSPVLAVGGPPQSSRVDQIPVAEVLGTWRGLLAAAGTRGPGTRPTELH